MAGEVTKRIQYLVLRREGFENARVKVPVALKQNQADLDGLVDPIPTNDDIALIEEADLIPSDDRDLVTEYTWYSITAAWEANELI